MLSMAYCNPSDMDFLDTVSMDSHDIQSEMEKILANADFLNSENSNHGNSAFDFDTTGPNSIDDWIQNIQWNEVAKVHNVMDSSFEIDNNNPNLIVNPQSVMPIAVAPARHSSPKKTAFSQIGTQTKPNSTAVNVQGSVYGSEALGLKIENVVSLNPQYIEKNNNLATTINSTVQETAMSVQSPSRVSKPVTVSLSNSAVSSIDLMEEQEKVYPKPVYSYSCLIAMALKNSRKGSLPVSEIYSFMTEHFPYFKTAPDGWKNSVRHNLSLNKCFEKVDSPKMNGNTKKGCLWALNPAKILKMEDEIAKHRKKDLDSILKSMSNPDKLELIEAGKAGPPGSPKEDTPSPSQPIREEKNSFLSSDVGILENGIGLEQGLPDISFPSSGIWDEIRIDSVTSPSTTQVLTISAAPLSGPTTIATGNSSIYGILTCSSPMNTQNSRVTQSS
ncbi:forkhead box protein N4-like [Saccostrea echinata]|uniref:forkhead box protein N4-like n=1 Tax=Saccostrea echinata TaxID=191078 RepID=UPI002A7FE51A|nr:forkhead box protein N4-like [Saccostrea echinata]XP_061178104.1 forkhead box protein N4-like [Saccostrea echinata]